MILYYNKNRESHEPMSQALKKFLNKVFWLNVQIKPIHKPMGRWVPKTCSSEVNMSNYYSNIDHCGGCQYEKFHIEKMLREKN